MLIHELRLAGLLSFGPDTPPLPMERLNILVGPNGSGKSNFIEAIALLRSAATKLTTPIREKGGGGVTEWIWKGKPDGMAAIDATIKLDGESDLIRHSIEFAAESQRFVLLDERIGKDVTYPSQPDGLLLLSYFERHSASERTQLVVTTHSDILIDAMTERPECVVVFDKQDGITSAKRLNADDLKIWLKDYRLGRLWTDGQIGGVRW